MTKEIFLRRVDRLVPGDRLDLEGDKYADPNRDKPELECELYLIEEIERENNNCIVLYSATSGGNFAFPADHLVRFDSHDGAFDEEKTHKCARCGQFIPEGTAPTDGCRDPDCPERG